MSSFLVDTSVLVARIAPWHRSHHVVRTDWEKRARRGEIRWIAAHSLVETYSVLTRLPAPYTLSPNNAGALVEKNAAASRIASLPSDAVRKLLSRAARFGIAGGTVYDGLILASAEAAKVDCLVTLNPDDFLRFQPKLAVVSPGAN